MMFYVYIIRNKGTGEIYIGYTDNLERRMKEHKTKNPELIYYEAYKSKIDAQNRERKLKQRGQSIRWLKGRIKYSLEA
ncbi:MAG: GIY-YIG catalytic domain protein [Microgenomates group bacterium GW2011_GWB1_40_9]|nr:MAG: GIY-YIG catalytic domain protein [Microgenomates group bacterium GW2011_GWB1_40_9]